MTQASFPKCQTVNTTAFAGCGMTVADFPACTTLGSQAFRQCPELMEAHFTGFTGQMPQGVFASCPNLYYVEFKDITGMGDNSKLQAGPFYNCAALATLDFGTRTVNTIPDYTYASDTRDIFYGVPSSCRIIVPDSLYTEWTQNSNWTRRFNTIVRRSNA